MKYHCISCVSRVKYNSSFKRINMLFSENPNENYEMEVSLKKLSGKIQIDCLKFKQLLSLT